MTGLFKNCLAFIGVFSIMCFGACVCYNLDGRNVEVVSSLQNGDLFGYSLILRNGGSVLVGAPKGNSTYKPDVDNPGVLYECSFTSKGCAEHAVNSLISGIGEIKEDGAMFAMTMDGGPSLSDDVTVCAPKTIKFERSYPPSFFTNGACRTLKSNQKIAPLGRPGDQIDRDPIPYYKYAFAEMGMSLKYFKDQSSIVFGAPGLYSWAGGLLRLATTGMAISSKNAYGYNAYDYVGYSVEIGRFVNSSTYWGVTAAPRAKGLLGQVIFFSLPRISLSINSLNGEKIGAYFGASLLASDVNANGVDDLFVGAPTYSINQYDEGCVYFYKSKGDGSFHNPVKMFGSQTVASRFGTTIADLGDINHDGFKDVAISAPYEQQTGVVYIYLGNIEGITQKYSQRIQPEDFHPATTIRGFGISLSKGVDVDDNSYNDVAIGAYTSSKVVLLRSQAIMEYGTRFVALEKEVSAKEHEEFAVQFCIRMVSDVSNVLPVETELELVADDRVTSSFYQQIVNVTMDLYCLNITLKLTNNIFGSTNPISLSMEYHQVPKNLTEFCSNCPVVNPAESSRVVLEIPFAHGCGADGVCNTQLSIEASFDSINSLVLGSRDSVSLKVDVTNQGEPAYLCQLIMLLPNEVNLEQVPTGCTLELQQLKCLVGNNFIKGQKKEMTFDLDVSKIDSNTKSLDVFFNVSSVGEETIPEDNELTLSLPVTLDINPLVLGKAFPDETAFASEAESIPIKHLFAVTNLGKSPFDVEAVLAIPVKVDGVTVAEIQSVEASRNNEASLSCSLLDSEVDGFNPSLSSVAGNGTEMVACGGDAIDCAFYSCGIGRLGSSSYVATVSVKMTVKSVINDVFSNEQSIAFGTIIHVDMNGVSVKNDTVTLFESQKQASIPLWITIAASVGGFLIVLIIVFVMWKFNFFRRTYKEKLLLSEENDSVTTSEHTRQQ